jgi:uncharacterized protein (TIGR03382 family)
MLALLVSLAVSPAFACSFVTGSAHEVVANPDDTVAPTAATEEGVSIVRGVGPQCVGPACSSSSCDDLGRIELSLGAASDDVSAAENIGYRLRVIEGALPDGLTVDETRRADSLADGTANLLLLWIDEAEDEQEPFDFVLGVTPIDEAGNEGEELSIPLADEGRAAGGCATVHGGGAGALALGLLAAAARGRRR